MFKTYRGGESHSKELIKEDHFFQYALSEQ